MEGAYSADATERDLGAGGQSMEPTQADPSQAPDVAPAEGGERGEGRRRGRGGRDRNRRERPDQAPAQALPSTNGFGDALPFGSDDEGAARPSAAWAAAPIAADVVERSEPAAEPEHAPWRPAPIEPMAAAATPVAEARPVAVAAVAAAEPAAAVVPAVSVKSQAEVEPFILPVSTLQEVAAASGLTWVGSDADKIRAVQAAMANEPKPVHVPRELKPVVQLDDGPLVLVETRKDLSQFKLPFETAVQETPPAQ